MKTNYTYAGNNTIVEEIFEQEKDKLKLEGTKENIYSNSIDDIVASVITKGGKSKVYYYTKNQLNSITAITDEKGKVVEEYKYDVFGKAYTRDGKSENWREFNESKIDNTRLFTGRDFDREINLYYYRARYYSADLGRFISRDPIGQVDDVNLYSYVGNNSVNFVDPSGLEKQLFIKNNEGNAWYFESMDILTGNSGHAAMYFINNGQEYLINYNPLGSTGLNPSGNGDMFFGTVNGTNEGISNINYYRSIIMNGSDDLYSIIKIKSNYINASKLSERYNTNYAIIPSYNTFTNNCSDQVEAALEYSGFFEITEIYGIPTPIPGNILLLGTTPGGLGYDINLELFYKNLVY